MVNTRFQDATYERQVADLVRQFEPRIRTAFLAAMRDIRSRTQMARLRDALRNGDISEAVDALNIDPSALVRLQSTILEVYSQSGNLTISGRPWIYPDGTRAVVRWNSLSPLAESYARTLSSRLIVGLSDEAQAIAREVIADGYAYGRSFDRIARDLVGRIGANGRRSGGVVGLDRNQLQWVRNLSQYLDGDLSRALGMKLSERDKAFIRRLIKEGRAMTQAQIDGMLRRYENNLLMSRGLRIARTETITAIEKAKADAWRQGLEKTGVPERFLIRRWVHTGRSVIDRVQHQAINGEERRGFSDPHVLPDQTRMLHPHDTSLGAGPNQIVHCMCREDYRIDKAGLRAWLG